MKTWMFAACLMSLPLPAFAAEAEASPARVLTADCEAGQECLRFRRSLSLPANALGYGHNPNFALHPRGVEWPGRTGSMSLTVRRPADYKGGPVRVSLFHQVIDDNEGDIVFHVTAVAFNHGNSFETYGAVATNALPAPGSPTLLLQQSAVLRPGNGWNPGADWWYLELGRGGTFDGRLRLMSVALEY